MKTFLFIVLTFALANANTLEANTYYFSTKSGKDSRKESDAQNPSTPWQTLDQLNKFYPKLRKGDVILFKRGEVFEGSIVVPGTEKDNAKSITFGAYGVGAKPVITGFRTIKGWKAIGGGIYEKIDKDFSETLNMVLVNNKLQPMGRWPKLDAPNGGYLTLQSHQGTRAITSSEISSLPSFVGGEVVIRKVQWILDRGRITQQTSNTITYDSFPSPGHPSYTYEPLNNFGFFFQNHVKTLTQLGDWCYDGKSKKIKMFFGASSPNTFDVKVSVNENLFDLFYGDNVTIDNLAFTGANTHAINFFACNNIKITNCDISYSGVNAINANNRITVALSKGNSKKDKDKEKSNKNKKYSYTVAAYSKIIKVDNCNITNTNNNAINSNNSSDWTITNNVIENTGTIKGMGVSGDAQYNAIQYINTNSVVKNNTITNTGYLGIHFIGDNIVIENNVINHFCMVKSDGGGIYTHGATGTNRKIRFNIVSDGIGDMFGINTEDFADPNSNQVHGLYMDGQSDNVLLENNTSFNNPYAGLFIGSTTNITARNNLLYNNRLAQIKLLDSEKLLENTTLNNNVCVARTRSQLVVSNQLRQNGPSILVSDYNYFGRPIYELNNLDSIYGYIPIGTFDDYPNGAIVQDGLRLFYSLDMWKIRSGYEAHTTKSPIAIDDLSKLRFEYNPTTAPKSISLDAAYVDMKNVSYSDNLTLAPFTGIVLLKQITAPASMTMMNHSSVNAIEIAAIDKTGLSVAPNPSNGVARIKITPVESGAASVDVFDLQGHAVKRLFTGLVEAGVAKIFNLNSSNLPSGEYIIRISTNTTTLTKKIIVNK